MLAFNDLTFWYNPAYFFICSFCCVNLLIYHFCFPSFVLWIQVTTIHGHFLSSILALNHHFCVVIGKYRGFHVGSTGKESASNAGDPDVILGLGRYPGEGIGYLLCTELSWRISG